MHIHARKWRFVFAETKPCWAKNGPSKITEGIRAYIWIHLLGIGVLSVKIYV